jgi:hypothetical protein
LRSSGGQQCLLAQYIHRIELRGDVGTTRLSVIRAADQRLEAKFQGESSVEPSRNAAPAIGGTTYVPLFWRQRKTHANAPDG